MKMLVLKTDTLYIIIRNMFRKKSTKINGELIQIWEDSKISMDTTCKNNIVKSSKCYLFI